MVRIFAGAKSPGMNFLSEILHCGYLTEFLCEIIFICFTFSSPTQFCMWRCSRGCLEMSGGNFQQDWKEKFSMGGDFTG